MNNLQKIKLSDICSYESSRIGVGVLNLEKYISTENMLSDRGGVAIANSLPATSNVTKFCKGQVLVSNIRPYFKKIWQATFDGGCSNDVLCFSLIDGVDERYFYYLLSQDLFFDYIMMGSKGTKMPRGDKKQIMDFEFILPSLPEQKRIADILSSLDDKIDLLSAQNRTLEQLAETLFRQNFIENPNPEWKLGKLDEEMEIIMGQSPSGSSYNENKNGVPMFQGNADFNFRFPTNRVYTTEPKKIANEFDTLVSVRAPVGEQNMAIEKCCIGRGVAAFRYKQNNKFNSYTFYKIKSLMFEIKQFNDTGTVFGSISKSDFCNIESLIADGDAIEQFQIEVGYYDNKIYNNTKQITTLTKLRDTLLLKLMSNEIKL